MLGLYRRHTGSCGQKSRRYRRCSCPVWVQGTLGGEEIRKSLDLTSWEAAEKVIFAWKVAGKIGAEGKPKVSVHDASERYLRDAATRLKPSTVDLYRRGAPLGIARRIRRRHPDAAGAKLPGAQATRRCVRPVRPAAV